MVSKACCLLFSSIVCDCCCSLVVWQWQWQWQCMHSNCHAGCAQSLCALSHSRA